MSLKYNMKTLKDTYVNTIYSIFTDKNDHYKLINLFK